MSAPQFSTPFLNPDVLSSQTLRGTLTTSIEAPRAHGTITVDNGQVTSRVITAAGTRSQTTSIEQFSQDLANTLAQVQGTIAFNRGVAQTNLQSPLGNFTETIHFAQTTRAIVENWLKTVSGDIPFQNGQFNIDTSTVFGTVKGSIEVGNGALVTNLTTPLGYLFTSIDLKPEDQYKFQLGRYPGAVNFDDGLVVVSTQPGRSSGDIAVPINALSGSLHVKNGEASVKIPTPIGTATAKFDLSALVSRAIVNSLQASGTISVKNGIATIDTGSTQTTLDLPAIAASSEFRQSLTTLAESQPNKTLSFDPIGFVSNFTTVSGSLASKVDLTALSR